MTGALDTSSLSPSDAAVALRSYPRRFRAALASVDPDAGDLDELARRAGPDGRSALDHTVHAARTFALLDRALEQVIAVDQPVLHPAVGDAAARDWDSGDVGSVADALAELEPAAGAFADRVDRVASGDWARRGGLAGGGTVTALQLVRDAVRTGHDDLRAAERALAAAR